MYLEVEEYLNYPNIPSKMTYTGDRSNRYGAGLCRQEIQDPSGHMKRNMLFERFMFLLAFSGSIKVTTLTRLYSP